MKKLVVSMVTYEMTVLVAHTEDDSREEIIRKATGATGEVNAGTEEVSLLEDDEDLDDYGVQASDGVDTVTSAAEDARYWTLGQIMDDTDEAAHNRAMNKKQLTLDFKGNK